MIVHVLIVLTLEPYLVSNGCRAGGKARDHSLLVKAKRYSVNITLENTNLNVRLTPMMEVFFSINGMIHAGNCCRWWVLQ